MLTVVVVVVRSGRADPPRHSHHRHRRVAEWNHASHNPLLVSVTAGPGDEEGPVPKPGVTEGEEVLPGKSREDLPVACAAQRKGPVPS